MKKAKLKRRVQDLSVAIMRLIQEKQALQAQVIKLGTYTEEPPGEPSMLFYCACGRMHTLYRPNSEHAVTINRPGGDL